MIQRSYGVAKYSTQWACEPYAVTQIDRTDGQADHIPYGAKNLILRLMIQITQMFLLVKLLVGDGDLV